MKKTHRLGAIALATLAVAAPSALAQGDAPDAPDATIEHSLAVEAAADATGALAAMRQDGEAQPAPIADPKLDDSVEKGELATGGVSLSLPTQGESVTVGKSVISDTSLQATTLIAQAIPSGVRAMFTLADASAPTRFVVPVEGAVRLEIQPDGSVLVFTQDAGPAAYVIPAAWAKDATGRSIPTYYEVSGTVLTQVVEHTKVDGVAYPVVADPTLKESMERAKMQYDDALFAFNRADQRLKDAESATASRRREYSDADREADRLEREASAAESRARSRNTPANRNAATAARNRATNARNEARRKNTALSNAIAVEHDRRGPRREAAFKRDLRWDVYVAAKRDYDKAVAVGDGEVDVRTKFLIPHGAFVKLGPAPSTLIAALPGAAVGGMLGGIVGGIAGGGPAGALVGGIVGGAASFFVDLSWGAVTDAYFANPGRCFWFDFSVTRSYGDAVKAGTWQCR